MLTIGKDGFGAAKLSGIAVSTGPDRACGRQARTQQSRYGGTSNRFCGGTPDRVRNGAELCGRTSDSELFPTSRTIRLPTMRPYGLEGRSAGRFERHAKREFLRHRHRRPAYLSAISANGGAAFTNDIQVDGVCPGLSVERSRCLPNPDGVQEVRTIINNFSAEYGRAQAVLQVTTKSGANEYHGSAFYRNRNEVFNANTFANNARAIARRQRSRSVAMAVRWEVPSGATRRSSVSYEGLKHSEAVEYLKTVPPDWRRKVTSARRW